jgi:hypothetical protein
MKQYAFSAFEKRPIKKEMEENVNDQKHLWDVVCHYTYFSLF